LFAGSYKNPLEEKLFKTPVVAGIFFIPAESVFAPANTPNNRQAPDQPTPASITSRSTSHPAAERLDSRFRWNDSAFAGMTSLSRE